ncbi:hypothetical protein AGMMS49587_02150 [Spirochaetia bacterium]|nr:hypothetical protein AGMMS49587_02150 [Spirochaetia bacterium]
MRKNQLWTMSAALLLIVSLFVMGCKTDEAPAAPPSASQLAAAFADDLEDTLLTSGDADASGSTVNVTDAVFSVTLPVPAGVTLSFTNAPAVSGSASITGSTGSKVIFTSPPTGLTTSSNFYVGSSESTWNTIVAGLYTWTVDKWVKDTTTKFATASGNVSGVVSTVITGDSITINLINDKFKAVSAGTDVSSWITNLPFGLAAVSTNIAADDTQAIIVIGGVPTTPGTGTFTFTIPANVLDGNAEISIDSGDSGAQWEILANPPLELTDGLYTKVSTLPTGDAGVPTAPFDIFANSTTITIKGANSKIKTWTKDVNVGADEAIDLLGNLAVNDTILITSGDLDTITLKTVPASSAAAKINGLLAEADVTLDYATPALGDVIVPDETTLTITNGTAAVATGKTLTLNGTIAFDGTGALTAADPDSVIANNPASLTSGLLGQAGAKIKYSPTSPANFDSAISALNAAAVNAAVVIDLTDSTSAVITTLTFIYDNGGTGKITIKDTKASASKTPNTAGIYISRPNVELNGLKFAITSLSGLYDDSGTPGKCYVIITENVDTTITSLDISATGALGAKTIGGINVVDNGANLITTGHPISVTNNTINFSGVTGLVTAGDSNGTYSFGIGTDVYPITITGNTVTAVLGFDYEALTGSEEIPIGGTYTSAGAVGRIKNREAYLLDYPGTAVTSFGSDTAHTAADTRTALGNLAAFETLLGASFTGKVWIGDQFANECWEYTTGTLGDRKWWDTSLNAGTGGWNTTAITDI